MRGAVWRGSATVDAGAPRVIGLLRERLGNRWIGVATVEALHDGVAVEHGWWYRAEYHVEPLGDDLSRVTNEVRNVAPTVNRWMVPLVARSRPAQHRAAFVQLLDSIGGGELDEPPG